MRACNCSARSRSRSTTAGSRAKRISLKSAAGTFGYVRLAVLALRLEKTAERLGDAGFRDLLDLMDAAYAAGRAQEPEG
ncbi:HPt (histidine-containing phosphotransfer) domain-containing protein [Bradyrhizobium sp. F1.13.1]